VICFSKQILARKNIITLYSLAIGLGIIISGGCNSGSDRYGKDTPPDFGSPSLRTPTAHRTETKRGGSIFSRVQGGQARQGHLTILLAQYNDANKVQEAQALQQRAQRLLGTDDIWLTNEELGLAVHYGHFENMEEAQKGKEQVKKMYKKLQPGRWQIFFVKEIPGPDPAAPGQWDLLQSECDYSLEIGTYYNVPEKDYYERKKDAVEAVRVLRESGQTAYFVHGRLASRVYVGCIPASQVRPPRDPSAPITIVSPEVKLLQKQYPHYYEHGAILYVHKRDKLGRDVKLPVQSAVVGVEYLRQKRPY